MYLKFTDDEDKTGLDRETQWGAGVRHTAPGEGGLCTDGWIHLYQTTTPLLPVMLDPIHGNYGESAHLWECEIAGPTRNDAGLKLGVGSCTTIRRITMPVVTLPQRLRFAIYCAREVYSEPAWLDWANDWLAGKNRSRQAAAEAENAAITAAAGAAITAAAWPAEAAVWPAEAAACAAAGAAAEAAGAAAEAAAWAAEVAAWAAAEAGDWAGTEWAATAVEDTARISGTLDLDRLAQEAVADEPGE